MKTLMRTIALAALYLFPHCINAQGVWESGYIIRAGANDTIRGLVNNKGWGVNPKEILFLAPDGQKHSVGVSDIDEFAVKSEKTTEVYRKKILDIDKGVFELKDLKDFPSPRISRDTVFATLYESGTINLYYLEDETGRIHYFVEKNDTGIQDLGIQRYIDVQAQAIRSKDLYKSQLNILMSDCAGIILKISELAFKEKELRKLVTYYNNCAGGNKRAKYSQAKEKTDFFVGALLGAGMGFETMSGIADYPSEVHFGPSLNLDAALNLSLVLPRTNKHVEMGVELGWGYFKEATTLSVSTDQGHNNYQLYLAAHLLKGNLLFRYLLPVKKVKFTFTAGLSMGGILSSVNQMNETIYFYGISSQVNDKIPISSWKATAILGAGVRYSNLNIELRYFIGSSLFDGGDVNSLSNSLNLTVYYNFYSSATKKKETR